MVTDVCDTDEWRIDECRCGGTGAGAVADSDCELDSKILSFINAPAAVCYRYPMILSRH